MTLPLLLAVTLLMPSVGWAGGEPGGQPSPTPTPSPSPSPTPPPSPSPTPSPAPSPTVSPTPRPSPIEDDEGDGGRPRKKKEKRKRASTKDEFELGGPQNTARLIAILSELEGVPLQRALLRVVGPFPVAGLTWWTDDWHAPRCCPTPHLHEGLDMFAREGTPLVAAADGIVTSKTYSPSAAGLGLQVTDEEGTEFFYAHLSEFAEGIGIGTHVEMGQVVGYVGNTGNAQGTLHHLHFEIQPGGIPVPPKPYVDRWLRQAERRALRLAGLDVDRFARRLFEDIDFRLTRGFQLLGLDTPTPGGPTAEELLLILSGIQPAGAPLGLARDTVGQMAWEIDWGRQAAIQLDALVSDYERFLSEQEMLASESISTVPAEIIAPDDPAQGFSRAATPGAAPVDPAEAILRSTAAWTIGRLAGTATDLGWQSGLMERIVRALWLSGS